MALPAIGDKIDIEGFTIQRLLEGQFAFVELGLADAEERISPGIAVRDIRVFDDKGFTVPGNLAVCTRAVIDGHIDTAGCIGARLTAGQGVVSGPAEKRICSTAAGESVVTVAAHKAVGSEVSDDCIIEIRADDVLY